MNAQDLLDELGKVLNTQIEFTADNTCAMAFDDDIIEFETKDQELYLISTLAPLEGLQERLSELLEASFLGMETGYASFGIEKNNIMLFRMLNLPLEYAEFESALYLFIQAVRYWKEYLHLAGLNSPHTQAISDSASEVSNYIKV